MNYYLIDYENVKTHGLDGISKLYEDDVVCIFYSKNADSLTFDLHKRINESQATIVYQKVDVGSKNALDFQLATYLGYIIHENTGKAVSYSIVSKDQGFLSLVDYWKKRKIEVSLVIDVSGKNEKSELNKLKTQVEQIIKDKEVIDVVVKFIQQYKTKQGINNALMKQYPSKDNKKASEIYNVIKPILNDKKDK
ncbi:PIN domain-containing protein [Anaerosporobacter sp.]